MSSGLLLGCLLVGSFFFLLLSLSFHKFSLLLLLSLSSLFFLLSVSCLSLGSLLCSSLLFGLGLSSTIISLFLRRSFFSLSVTLKHLCNQRRRISLSCGCLVEILQEVIGLLTLLPCDDLDGLHINLLADSEGSQVNNFLKHEYLLVLLGDCLADGLVSDEDPLSEASGRDGGRDNIVDVSEGRPFKQLLGHLWLLEQLLKAL